MGVSAPILGTGTSEEYCAIASYHLTVSKTGRRGDQEKEEDRSVTFGLALQVQGGPCDLHPWTVLHSASIAYIPKSAKRTDSISPPLEAICCNLGFRSCWLGPGLHSPIVLEQLSAFTFLGHHPQFLTTRTGKSVKAAALWCCFSPMIVPPS